MIVTRRLRRVVAPAGPRGQAGVSLVETLVALVLVSLLIAALVNGLLSSTTATGTSNRAQRNNLAVTSFGERLKQLPYQECADPGWYNAAYEDLVNSGEPGEIFNTPDNVTDLRKPTVEVTDVAYWSPGSFANGARAGGSFEPNCVSDGGSQLITIRVTFDDIARTSQIVKRNPVSVADLYGTITTTTAGPPSGPHPPIARILPSVVRGPATLNVIFDASGSTDDGTIVDYSWNFNNGTAIQQGPAAVVVGGSFTPGRYLVKLTVTDNTGAQGTASLTIVSEGKPSPPTGLTKVGSGYDIGRNNLYFDLRWDPVPGVQQYQIQWTHAICSDGSALFTGASGRMQGPWCPSWIFPFQVSIRARAGDQWSDWSSPVAIKK